jgi:putative addiction module killer protein
MIALSIDKMYPAGYIESGSFLLVQPRELQIYKTPGGKLPFEDWLQNLSNIQARAVIRQRLNKVRAGNLGDVKSVGGGVIELRIHFGPGYRVYLGEDGPTVVVLLLGGDKTSQRRDIKTAQTYWQDYLTS